MCAFCNQPHEPFLTALHFRRIIGLLAGGKFGDIPLFSQQDGKIVRTHAIGIRHPFRFSRLMLDQRLKKRPRFGERHIAIYRATQQFTSVCRSSASAALASGENGSLLALPNST